MHSMNEQRMRILHLSDLHERVIESWMTLERQSLIAQSQASRWRILDGSRPKSFCNILKNIQDEWPVNLLCFTGDIADWGLETEYHSATKRLDIIRNQIDGLSLSRIFPIPGNHDINRNIEKEAWSKLRAFAQEGIINDQALSAWLGGYKNPPRINRNLPKRILKRQEAFWNWVRTSLQRPDLLPGFGANHPLLGYRHTLRFNHFPVPIHVIGLNSAWLCGDDYDCGRIRLTQGQIDSICTESNSSGAPLVGFRIALMHHRFSDLQDSQIVRPLLAERVDLILHGHQHEPEINQHESGLGLNRILAAGCLYEGDEGDRYKNSFNVIDVFWGKKGLKKLEITFFSWSKSGFWHRDSALYPNAQNGRLIWDINKGKGSSPSGQLINYKLVINTPRGNISKILSWYQQQLQQQRQLFLDTPLLSWSPYRSPTFAKLWPSLVVSPTLLIHGSDQILSWDLWLSQRSNVNRVIFIGPPGCGKSIALRSIFLKLASEYPSTTSKVPWFIDTSFLDESNINLLQEHLHKIAHAHRNRSAGIALFIDGIDEISPQLTEILIDQTLQNLPIKTDVYLACRDEYLYTNLSQIRGRTERLGQRIEILPWDEQLQAAPFIKNYFTSIGRPEDTTKFLSIFHNNLCNHQFLLNPFKLTLCLYLYILGELNDTEEITNNYFLYFSFYRQWLVRESIRGTSRTHSEYIRQLHVKIAEITYRAKRENRRLSTVVNELGISAEDLMDTGFRDILGKKIHPITSEETITGFIHESLAEFLLASELLMGFLNLSTRLPDLLGIEYNNEVNAFVRGGLLSLNETQCQRVDLYLSSLYLNLLHRELGTAIENLSEAVYTKMQVVWPEKITDLMLAREQLVYYLGRIPYDAPEHPILKLAYYRDPESIIRRSAALGAILRGDSKTEEDFMLCLKEDISQQSLNRSVQLVYFGDASGNLKTFEDNGHIEWIGVRRAIFERLQRNGIRELRLRWWDLFTLVSFLSSRADSILNEQEVGILESCVIMMKDSTSTRRIHIEKLRDEILCTFKVK